MTCTMCVYGDTWCNVQVSSVCNVVQPYKYTMGSTYGSGFVSSVEDGRVRTWLDGFYVNCASNTCTMCIYINDVLWVYFLVYVINW